MSTTKLSDAQRIVLRNLMSGKSAGCHLRGRSERGGREKVMASLERRGLISRYPCVPPCITTLGIEAMREVPHGR